jgi:omega-6 fatty acid desaturase (delta-12 desaturase)
LRVHPSPTATLRQLNGQPDPDVELPLVSADTAHGSTDARQWTKRLVCYQQPSLARSWIEILVTVVPFAALWTVTAVAIMYDQWWGLILTIPTAGFLVRLFVLQHDCGHGALFPGRRANDWTGRALGVLTFTPYDYWRRTHAVHHATAGNLDKRGIGDVLTLTVREYRALSPLARSRYWLYRHPVVMFGLGPAWLFVCQHRLPIGLMRSGALPWISALGTNLGIVLPALGLIWIMGVWPFLLVQLPITLMAATAGVWLFYVQHQFETTHWADDEAWQFQHAALHGSSNYELPAILRWFSGNIGIHHIHHLSSRIPFYHLPKVLDDHPELNAIGRVTLLESLKGVRLVLWDEHSGRLVSFREARRAT